LKPRKYLPPPWVRRGRWCGTALGRRRPWRGRARCAAPEDWRGSRRLPDGAGAARRRAGAFARQRQRARRAGRHEQPDNGLVVAGRGGGGRVARAPGRAST
jgi:hypothetical protein